MLNLFDQWYFNLDQFSKIDRPDIIASLSLTHEVGRKYMEVFPPNDVILK